MLPAGALAYAQGMRRHPIQFSWPQNTQKRAAGSEIRFAVRFSRSWIARLLPRPAPTEALRRKRGLQRNRLTLQPISARLYSRGFYIAPPEGFCDGSPFLGTAVASPIQRIPEALAYIARRLGMGPERSHFSKPSAGSA